MLQFSKAQIQLSSVILLCKTRHARITVRTLTLESEPVHYPCVSSYSLLVGCVAERLNGWVRSLRPAVVCLETKMQRWTRWMEKNAHCNAKADDLQPICNSVVVITEWLKINWSCWEWPVYFLESSLLTSHVFLRKAIAEAFCEAAGDLLCKSSYCFKVQN